MRLDVGQEGDGLKNGPWADLHSWYDNQTRGKPGVNPEDCRMMLEGHPNNQKAAGGDG